MVEVHRVMMSIKVDNQIAFYQAATVFAHNDERMPGGIRGLIGSEAAWQPAKTVLSPYQGLGRCGPIICRYFKGYSINAPPRSFYESCEQQKYSFPSPFPSSR